MPRAFRGSPKSRVALLAVLWMATMSCVTVRREPGATWHPTAPDTIPSGTLLSAQLKQSLSTADNHPGDRFTAELLDPVIDGTGQQLLPRGSVVSGRVRALARSNGFGSWPVIELQVVGLTAPHEADREVPFEWAQTPVELSSVAARTAIGGLVGASAGAGVGLGINSKETAVVVGSAVVGLGVGVIAGYFLGPRDAVLPSGSILTLRVMKDVPWPREDATARAAGKVEGEQDGRGGPPH